jgi:hypothetical protein
VSLAGGPNSVRALGGRFPPEAPGGSPAPADAGWLSAEVAALAGLLAEVVRLTGDRAHFPSHWELIAESAMGHHSVRAALSAAQEE